MSKCCCSSENCCQPQPKMPLNIDFLYLDTTQVKTEGAPYQLPENLELYFSAKARMDETECQEKVGELV